MIPCWYNFVMKEFQGNALVLNCKSHKSAIPNQKYRTRYFVDLDRDLHVEQYCVNFERLARNPWKNLKDLLMKKWQNG